VSWPTEGEANFATSLPAGRPLAVLAFSRIPLSRWPYPVRAFPCNGPQKGAVHTKRETPGRSAWPAGLYGDRI